ncbi:glycosyltransferase [Oceanobacillus sp. Castelsardo]|uniref:glycosyltransferase n=1 Tax=Oceanobacillus sp. Castelsardo TaxID=1851204 RepID=UPI0018D43169|nr:glycosyltransferase [Oceanobacillus sp. Castelsardo]
MKNQITQNDKVYLLFPGHFLLGNKTKIKLHDIFEGIKVFELINPLPVPLMGGISKPNEFMKPVSPKDIYKKFLENINPEIIHIHTFMGIHQEFFIAAKELKIKMVYTTHDYFGISTKPNIIEESEDYFTYSHSAYSLPLIYLMQSKLYRITKDSKLTKRLRSYKKGNIKVQEEKNGTNVHIKDKDLSVQYKKLKDYYYKMLNSIDYFYFNSSIAKGVFEKFIDVKGEIAPVTHDDINDNRNLKTFDTKAPLKITFLGPLEEYKGFPLLREALNNLLQRNETNWYLNIYGNTNETLLVGNEKKYISFHGRYNHEKLVDIFNSTDILIVPSVWKETFGFIALEALSHGVPVLISEYVGSQDIIRHGKTGFIFKADSDELANLIGLLISNRYILQELNENICEEDFPWTMEIHTKQIKRLYEKIIGAN